MSSSFIFSWNAIEMLYNSKELLLTYLLRYMNCLKNFRNFA